MAESARDARVVVVTGGGRGLGLGIARRFALAGARVVLAELDAAAGTQASEALRREYLAAEYAPLDVRDPEQSRALVERLVAAHGRLDVWVNNAGVFRAGPAETLAREDWEACQAMLSGAFFCAQAAARQMLAQGGGVIVNVASVMAYAPVEGRVAYSTAKAGLVALTEALGIEWAGRGVRVVGVAPGVVPTEPVQAAMAQGLASRAAYERRTPLGRLGTVEEVAEAVFFLAGPEAAYVTAETLRVDGGWLAYQLF
jgi:NAD(P)-dependent dehydrogenase (short-subunit alcohol dehydrogenase family)